jgi:hypothetical protein
MEESLSISYPGTRQIYPFQCSSDGKPEGRRLLEKPRNRYEDNIKTDIKELGPNDVASRCLCW